MKFNYSLISEKGSCVFYFGFPDYQSKKKSNAEFEMNILKLNPSNSKMNSKERIFIESKLLDEMDNLKNQVYNNFKKYLEEKKVKSENQ